MSVAALVLAAGMGRRFGAAPKLLAPFQGIPLVRRTVAAAFASQARPVLVVTGHEAHAVAAALAGLGAEFVANPSYAEGLSSSLKAGFSALPPDAEAVVVLLGDMPLVGAALIDRLVARWLRDRPAAVVPVAGLRRGNPVVLSRELQPEVMRLSGDAGAGPLLKALAGVVEEPVDDPAALFDVDTPAALATVGGRVSGGVADAPDRPADGPRVRRGPPTPS